MIIDTKRLRELAELATPGPWTHDVDCFGPDDEIDAVVSNANVDLLFTSGTDIALHRGSGAAWTDEDDAKRDRQWAQARASQAYADAAFIAAASPTAVLALLDEIERLRAECRDGYQRRLDAADAAIIQVVVDVLSGGRAGSDDVPLDISAEWARVVRAIRMQVVLRHRAEKQLAERDSQLAAMTAARDEACEIAKRLAGLECDSGAEDRIAELWKVGAR
jgi:hypothetical protein